MYAGSDWDGELFDGEIGIRYKAWMSVIGDPYGGKILRNSGLNNFDVNEWASDVAFSVSCTF